MGWLGFIVILDKGEDEEVLGFQKGSRQFIDKWERVSPWQIAARQHTNHGAQWGIQ